VTVPTLHEGNETMMAHGKVLLTLYEGNWLVGRFYLPCTKATIGDDGLWEGSTLYECAGPY
jgi:hypothetical protein